MGFGANNGKALAIVKDETLGSFKMARIGRPFGKVTQDRLAAIAARLGVAPRLTPIRTDIRALDTGRRHRGVTKAASKELLPIITLFSVLSTYDATFDRFDAGTAATSWSIRGTRAGGEPFVLRRSNKWSSPWDLVWEPTLEITNAVDQLSQNEFERVRIDKIRFSSGVSQKFRQLRVVDAQVSVDGGDFSSDSNVTVEPGSTLTVRAVLQPYRSQAKQKVDLSVQVPADAAGAFGALLVGGSSRSEGEEEPGAAPCVGDDEDCSEPSVDSLDELLATIASAPRNDVVRANLFLGTMSETGPGEVNSIIAGKRVKQVVVGGKSFQVMVAGGEPQPQP